MILTGPQVHALIFLSEYLGISAAFSTRPRAVTHCASMGLDHNHLLRCDMPSMPPTIAICQERSNVDDAITALYCKLDSRIRYLTIVNTAEPLVRLVDYGLPHGCCEDGELQNINQFGLSSMAS